MCAGVGVPLQSTHNLLVPHNPMVAPVVERIWWNECVQYTHLKYALPYFIVGDYYLVHIFPSHFVRANHILERGIPMFKQLNAITNITQRECWSKSRVDKFTNLLKHTHEHTSIVPPMLIPLLDNSWKQQRIHHLNPFSLIEKYCLLRNVRVHFSDGVVVELN